MRIIAGEFRGRRLLAPEGDVTRPITDRVKQSLFDILTPEIPDATVYDLFAGTGSMGLECLSRGANQVTFFESDRSALARLRKNIDAIAVADRARVLPGDLFNLVASATDEDLNLIFLDPPYRFLRERAHELRKLAKILAAKLAPDGIVIFRHDTADTLELAPLVSFDRRDYGGMTIELLRKPVSTPA